MKFLDFNDLDNYFKNEEVRYYYKILENKKFSLFTKRVFDFTLALILSIFLFPVILVVAVIVKFSSKGPIFYKQERVTTYKKLFKIYKFRTMVENADKIGESLTLEKDTRITKFGRFLRKTRIDEIPQLLNVLKGEMSFVGTRPEVLKYVERYEDCMKATLLMPAGITSLASINFKDEEKYLNNKDSLEVDYLEKILPIKMRYNLDYLERFNFFYDMKILFKTFLAVLFK